MKRVRALLHIQGRGAKEIEPAPGTPRGRHGHEVAVAPCRRFLLARLVGLEHDGFPDSTDGCGRHGRLVLDCNSEVVELATHKMTWEDGSSQ